MRSHFVYSSLLSSILDGGVSLFFSRTGSHYSGTNSYR